MAAFVQTITPAANSGSTAVLTRTGVTAGNTLIVGITQTGSGARTYTVSSDLSGAFSSVVSYFPSGSRGVQIFMLRSVAAGTHTITVTQSSTAAAFWAGGVEVTPRSAITVTGTNLDASGSNTHHCATAGNIDTTGEAFIFCTFGMASFSGITSYTAGTNYTIISAGAPNQYWQYYDATGAVTDDRGQFTNAGSAQQGHSAMAAFYPESTSVQSSGFVSWFGR